VSALHSAWHVFTVPNSKRHSTANVQHVSSVPLCNAIAVGWPPQGLRKLRWRSQFSWPICGPIREIWTTVTNFLQTFANHDRRWKILTHAFLGLISSKVSWFRFTKPHEILVDRIPRWIVIPKIWRKVQSLHKSSNHHYHHWVDDIHLYHLFSWHFWWLKHVKTLKIPIGTGYQPPFVSCWAQDKGTEAPPVTSEKKQKKQTNSAQGRSMEV